MRIWSLHPQYLDAKGIVALWREALLAKKVLQGKTKGYKNHPQLIRFKNANNPIEAINQYLFDVHENSISRGYKFNGHKIDMNFTPSRIDVTQGQLAFETKHLQLKLKIRDPKKLIEIKGLNLLECHPMFKVIPGEIESWERP
ncbi:MAG: pyrimidine dimer DNA glycosylase/endonuclease V [Aurantibacter sp.]